jgi:hypothetical protein
MRPYSRSASRRANDLFWGLTPRRFHRAAEIEDPSDRQLLQLERPSAQPAQKPAGGRLRHR